MRRKLRFGMFAFLALSSLAVLAACGGSSEGSSDPQGSGAETAAATAETVDVQFESPENDIPLGYPQTPENADLKIGLLNPRAATESLQYLYDPAKERVAELGGEAIELDAQAKPDRQVTQFEQLLNQEVDAIGMLPIAEPKLLGPLLARAGKEGVPVIGFDVSPGVPEGVPGFAGQVWQRPDYTTYLKVKAAAEALGPGAKIGEIGLAIPVPLFEYTAERTEHWAQQFGLDLVDTTEALEDTVDSAQEAAAGLLAGNPDMEGVLGYTDDPAIGASLAARAADRDIDTFGIGGNPFALDAIESGRLTATVVIDAVAEGRTMAEGLYLAAQGKEIPPVVLAGDAFIATEDNVEEAREVWE